MLSLTRRGSSQVQKPNGAASHSGNHELGTVEADSSSGQTGLASESASPVEYSRRKSSVTRSLVGAVLGKVASRRQYGSKDDGPANAQWRFFDLPYELQVQVLSHLDFATLLVFRSCCRAVNEVVREHEYVLAQRIVRHHVPPLCRQVHDLFEPRNYSLRQVCRIHRRQKIVVDLAHLLAKFVADEYMQRNTVKKRAEFKEDLASIKRQLIPNLYLLHYYLERWRNKLLKLGIDDTEAQHKPDPKDYDYVITELTKRPSDAEPDAPSIAAYRALCDLWCFLCICLARVLRPPSYATSVERSVRGWSRSQPPYGDLLHVVLGGGVEAVRNVIAQKSYAARCNTVRKIQSRVNPCTAKFRIQWHTMTGDPFCVEPEPVSYDGVMILLHPRSQNRIITPTMPLHEVLFPPIGFLTIYNKGPRYYPEFMLGYNIVEFLRRERVQGTALTREQLTGNSSNNRNDPRRPSTTTISDESDDEDSAEIEGPSDANEENAFGAYEAESSKDPLTTNGEDELAQLEHDNDVDELWAEFEGNLDIAYELVAVPLCLITRPQDSDLLNWWSKENGPFWK